LRESEEGAGQPALLFRKKDMSALRKDVKQIRSLNETLGIELGRNPFGRSMYEWKYSESWIRPKRVFAMIDDKLVPEYDYFANPETGILEPRPAFSTEKVCLTLENQYVMSIWVASEDFATWRERYGDDLEWPKQGDYWPVSHPTGTVCLEPNMVPNYDITMEFVHQVKRDKQTTVAEFEAAFDERRRRKEKAVDEKLVTSIMDLLPLRDAIPGSRSFPIWPVGETTPDSRIKEPSKLWTPS